ncbi:amino acid ABC transporter permease [Paracoccaceae bacterium]|jgi:His/Glu/Gln/Arg/opine family amino acid ABC transporter permease subunit|nr:amino acid ABC transporter permease [Paracoccaceae bacterium]MDA9949313.1 amino acid ABC transporter permease [Paracoccaceae bacterium]MDB3912032.1 amino acid ABC transporter permease [Paracoccaceae bacterium]
MLDYRFQWRVVFKHWPELLDAAFLTLELTVLSVALGLMIGLVLSVWRRSDNRLLWWFTATWVALARNTPALLQIYLFYFGLGAVSIHMSSYAAVLAAITFNNAGYLTEILRGGMDAISPAQRNAAIGLGMRPVQVYVFVIIPQVLRIVFLPITNQIVWAMMGTSLGMIIGLQELTGMTTFLQSQTFRPFEFYLVAAVIYLIVAESILITARLTARYSFRW